MNKQTLGHVRKLLSNVRYRTLPEMRRDLEDGPWGELPEAVRVQWVETRSALNILLARREVEVRLRKVHEPIRYETGHERTRTMRHEYKLTTKGGKRFSLPRFFLQPQIKPAWE